VIVTVSDEKEAGVVVLEVNAITPRGKRFICEAVRTALTVKSVLGLIAIVDP